MNLRLRTLSIVTLTLLVLLAGLYGASSMVLVEGYERLEDRQIEQDILRARETIKSSLEALGMSALDWAHWDDTYAFMADRNAHYRSSNLVPTTYANLDLDLLLLVKPDGTAIAGGLVRDNGRIENPSDAVLRDVRNAVHAAARPSRDEVVTGLVVLRGRPMMMAAVSVLDSRAQGPSRGVLLMGRYLDAARLQRVAAIARLSLAIEPPEQFPQLSSDTSTVVQRAGNDRMVARFMLSDIAGKPAAALRMDSPRWIYQQGQVSQRYLLVNLAVAGAVFVGVVFVVLERLFLRRLARMDKAIGLIRHERNPAVRLPVEGTDELERLAATINETLQTLHETQERLNFDALHDPLTGLANRVLFLNRLAAALEKAPRLPSTRFAVLLVDIDHFKLINDSFGHTAGDHLLLSAAQRMAGCLRDVDTVARLGGDEFAILLDTIRDVADASRCAERLLESLHHPITWDSHLLHVSASIGVTVYCGGVATAEQMLRDADTAMYRAKQAGRNCSAMFDEHMHAQVVKRLEMENALRVGIRRGELRAYYQPSFDLRTGHLSGFEALVRWQHPENGLLMPDQFIPVAESAGLVGDVDRWMLSESCRCLAEWQTRFPAVAPITLSVNLSCTHAALLEVALHVRNVLARNRLDGSRLGLEITESALAVAESDLVDMLFELKPLGVRVYLDDFGTGHSSLSRLHRLPIDVLKIDRSFVGGLENGDGEIARTIVTLAHSLRMQVVAEGVETEAQLEKLRNFGCEHAQGYLFSRPMSEHDATRFLQQRHAGEPEADAVMLPTLSPVPEHA